jgi:hypothetical protein
MNSSEHLMKKKYRLFTSPQEIANNSVSRITTILNNTYTDSQEGISITTNPDIFNSKVKYLYTLNKFEKPTYNNANQFPLLIHNGASNKCDLTNIINNYSIKQINAFLDFLKDDKYDEVLTQLSTDETQKILYGLHVLKTTTSECFTNIITIYENIFLTIKYFYFLYGELLNNQKQFDKYKADSEILNDITKLKEYINKMQLNLNSVTVVAIESAKLNIKPEYLVYIQRYGVPYKTIFDKVLLQEIIDEMKNEK